MDAMQAELWQRIEAFEFDKTGAIFPFSARLARENGWSAEFARRAIEEYRKFVFLAMCAGHAAAPSDEVDQVWHLHLTYTRSYWDDWCGKTLRRALHHGPTKGGSHESDKFHDWYQQTLNSYHRFFGCDAPRDLWPTAATRFDARNRFVRVDARRNWVIAKPRWRILNGPNRIKTARKYLQMPGKTTKHTRKYLHFYGAVALLLLIAGCSQSANTASVFDFDGPRFLAFYAIFAPSVLIGARVWRHFWRLPNDEIGHAQLPTDSYHIALLANGEKAALNGALAEMAQKTWLQVREDGQVLRLTELSQIQNAHPLERAVLQTLGGTPQMRSPEILQSPPVRGMLEQMSSFLRAQELLTSQAHTARNATLALAMLAPLIGIIKIAVGLSRDKPVGYLVLMTLLALVLAVTFWPLPTRTLRGERALKQLRGQFMHLKLAQGRTQSRNQNAPLALAIGLYGLNILPSHHPLRQNLQRSGGDSGGSSGCGSDSGCGGGGCGGCGGGD